MRNRRTKLMVGIIIAILIASTFVHNTLEEAKKNNVKNYPVASLGTGLKESLVKTVDTMSAHFKQSIKTKN